MTTHVIYNLDGTTYHDELSMPIDAVIGQMARSGGILGAFEYSRPCWQSQYGVIHLLEVA